jgi:nucleoporin GLE1
MAGITTLYFAILQTPLSSLITTLPETPTPTQLPTLIVAPFRFPSAWTWLANACRDPVPAMEPTAHLITAWIENLSQQATQVYGARQIGKALDAVYREGIEGGKIKGDSESARQRLALVLESWKKDGISYPKGRDWE